MRIARIDITAWRPAYDWALVNPLEPPLLLRDRIPDACPRCGKSLREDHPLFPFWERRPGGIIASGFRCRAHHGVRHDD